MKKAVCLFCALSFMISLSACSSGNADTLSSDTISATETPGSVAISMEEYRGMVSAFNTKIMDEAVLLANVGTYEYNYWKTFSGLPVYGDMDYSAMVEHAMEWLSENSDSDADAVNAAYDDLIASYAAICDANVDGEVPSDMSELMDATFGAYYQLYLLVTQPSGEIEDFLTTLHDCSNAIIVFNEDLSSLLDT